MRVLIWLLLFCGVANAQLVGQGSGVGSSGGSITGLLNITPNYAGAGALSNGLCFNTPSSILTSRHCFGYGTTVPQQGQLELSTSNPSTNVLAITQQNATGFASITFRGLDPIYYTDSTTVFEHLAVGWLPASGTNLIESSTFDGNNNPLIPPSALIFQQTGGIDSTGGTSITCTPILNNVTMSCGSSGGANGTLVTGIGIQPATVVSSGGGTTTIVLSKAPTSSPGAETVTFTTPVYAAYNVFGFDRTGSINFYNWDATVAMAIDRVAKSVKVFDTALTFNTAGAISTTGANALILKGGNHIVQNLDALDAATNFTSTNSNATTNATAGFAAATGTANSTYGWVIQDRAGSPQVVYQPGTAVGNILYRGAAHIFQTVAGAADATINANGIFSNAGLTSSGTAATLTGSCTHSTVTGGAIAGTFTATCTAQTIIIALPNTTNGWHCKASDITTPANLLNQTASATNSATLTGTTGVSDIIAFNCIGY